MDVVLLEKAHKQPEEYPYVIVRKGGYSVRFNEMGEKERADFIELAKRMERNGA
jgi:pyruvate-formate lyase